MLWYFNRKIECFMMLTIPFFVWSCLNTGTRDGNTKSKKCYRRYYRPPLRKQIFFVFFAVIFLVNKSVKFSSFECQLSVKRHR